MIEGGIVPLRGRVTGTAIRAKFSIMLVILLMAGIAIRGRALVNIILVALFAFGPSMFPFQFEA